MEEEIDLRPYIEVLLKKWKWIVGVSVVTAVLAFVVSSLIPPTYSATAIVTIIDTREKIQLDPGISEVVGNQPLSAFPELALSDEVLRLLLEDLSLENKLSIDQFRSDLKSEAGADKSVIRLTARSKSAEMSARVANNWAELFVNWANRLYEGQGGEQLLFFEDQLKVAEESLITAEDELEVFQAINQTQIISNTLLIYQETHLNYLQQKERVDRLHDNAQALRTQMMNVVVDGRISYADQLTYLQLQLQTFNDDATMPVILDLDTRETLTTTDLDAQTAILDGLIETLAVKTIQIDEKTAEIEPQILALQQESQAAITKLSRLRQNVTVARGTYNSLAFQVEEERIVAQGTNSSFQLASKAAVSEKPLGTNKLILTIISGIVGFVAIVSVTGITTWWRISFKDQKE